MQLSMENNRTTIPELLSLKLIYDEKQLLKRSLHAYADQLRAQHETRRDFQELYRVRRMLRKLNELKLPR